MGGGGTHCGGGAVTEPLPPRIMHCTVVYPLELYPAFFGYYFFNAMMGVLQLLHIFWAFLIIRMAHKFITGKVKGGGSQPRSWGVSRPPSWKGYSPGSGGHGPFRGGLTAPILGVFVALVLRGGMGPMQVRVKGGGCGTALGVRWGLQIGARSWMLGCSGSPKCCSDPGGGGGGMGQKEKRSGGDGGKVRPGRKQQPGDRCPPPPPAGGGG